MRIYNEEVELEGRDPEQDYALYKNTCESLATLMGEIQELKASGAKEGVSTFLKIKGTMLSRNGEPFWKTSHSFVRLCIQSAEVEAKRRQGCVHFITLKKLNRLSHMRLKKARDQTHEVHERRALSVYSFMSYFQCSYVKVCLFVFFFAGEAESGRLAPAASESSL